MTQIDPVAEGTATSVETSSSDPRREASDQTVVIVAGADDKFALGLSVALFSAVRHLDPHRDAHVFVLDGGLSPSNRDRCRAALASLRPDIQVTVVDDDPERFANYNIHSVSRAAFLRLLIPEIVPERYRRVLYLDSDLVVSDDVSKLWRLPDEGKAFWAAHDEGVRGTDYVQQTLNFADVPADAPYFNSGVMLIDLPRWKAARVSERAQAILGEHSDRCINVDQDALNIVSVGNWSVLPPRWNFQVAGSQSWSAPPAPGETIGITHFINEKPWNPDTRCLRQATFDEALRASGWYTTQQFWRHRLRKQSTALKFWLRTSPALNLLRRVRRRIAREARRALSSARAS